MENIGAKYLGVVEDQHKNLDRGVLKKFPMGNAIAVLQTDSSQRGNIRNFKEISEVVIRFRDDAI